MSNLLYTQFHGEWLCQQISGKTAVEDSCREKKVPKRASKRMRDREERSTFALHFPYSEMKRAKTL